MNAGGRFAATERQMREVNASVTRDDARRARAIALAKEGYDDDDVEVMEEAAVESVDGGYWVRARIWIDAEAVEDVIEAEPTSASGDEWMLDGLASFARTALTDPGAVGLPAFDLNRIDSNAAAAGAVAYAVGKLDEIIDALNPAYETRETMARTLVVLGRHLEERVDEMKTRASDAVEPDRAAYDDAATHVHDAAALLKRAISSLRRSVET